MANTAVNLPLTQSRHLEPAQLALLGARTKWQLQRAIPLARSLAASTEDSLLAYLIKKADAKLLLYSPALIKFKDFDQELAEQLSVGNIRLLNAEVLKSGGLTALARRQELEERERAGGAKIFLSPGHAAHTLRQARRRVCFLTHGWRSCVHPDPDGATLAALVRFLDDLLGLHVVGVFIDFACLYQNPRTAKQDAAFGAALKVMANGCVVSPA